MSKENQPQVIMESLGGLILAIFGLYILLLGCSPSREIPESVMEAEALRQRFEQMYPEGTERINNNIYIDNDLYGDIATGSFNRDSMLQVLGITPRND